MTTAESALPGESAPSAPPRHSADSKVLLNVERFALPGLLVIILLFFSLWSKTGSISFVSLVIR